MLSFRVFTVIQQEELMGWHSSGVKRTRIQVIGVNFSDFLVSRERKLVRICWEFELLEFKFTIKVKMTGKWGKNPREIGLSWGYQSCTVF